MAGVFAGTARGAGLGAAIGAGACFLGLMGYLVHDAFWGLGRNAPRAGLLLPGFFFGAVCFGFTSLAIGGVLGAVLGAMVGSFFPIRGGRDRKAEEGRA